MSVAYVHLSDIHFGQEKGGGIVVNNDAKDQLLRDVRGVVGSLHNKEAKGIIVSGDIAYSGKDTEYKEAYKWLGELSAAVGCSRTAVQVVPGNHDIDLKSISAGTQLIIDDIIKSGDVALDRYLESEDDRNLLYSRFLEYRVFAAGYNCQLDGEGTILGDHYVEIAPGKHLKFHGINTALICSKNKSEDGSLLLGARQRVIPQKDGVEVIVIGHHPMNWLQDKDDAMRFIKNRAIMFISGHEHKPSHIFDEQVNLLCIAAGATVPPTVSDQYVYCYNVLEFDWDDRNNQMIVKIHPRIWDDEIKQFIADTKHYAEEICTFTLKCPNFTKQALPDAAEPKDTAIEQTINESSAKEVQSEITMPTESDQIVLLRFFRELSSSQRLSVLVQMRVIPEGISDKVTHTIETTALRMLFKEGKHEELQEMINQITFQKKEEKND